ncbi:MAG: phosphoglucosamine mutase [Planctomycetales bacterium]|nr:phosphoglucosamine mutase [Planctomycetales bacterium]
MPQELIISISGMRGLIGQNLFPQTAAAYGCAFGTFLKQRYAGSSKPSVAVGRDSRPSGQMLFSAVAAGLTAVGIDVVDLGICSTPGVGIMVRHLKCAGGVVITASHNPTPYNGIKLLLDNGISPPREMAEQIIRLYRDRQFVPTDALGCGNVRASDQTHQVHLEKVLAIVKKDMIASKRFKVVLDSVNGAGGTVSRMLLEALGCRVVYMNADPTGLFAHTPEPTAENLTTLCQKAAETGADIGFAQDPDADRLAIVDENGTYIGEEFTLAFAAKHVFSQIKGTAAANLSTSRMIDDIAAQAGCRVIRTSVGEANVANAMMQNQCVIGGEGNGGIIDLRVSPVRDSLVGMAMVLQLMADTGKTVSQLAAQMGGYCMYKAKYPTDKACAEAIIEKAKAVFADSAINTSDGCRFDLPDGWIHIRTSNTEPIMRIIIETKNPETRDNYLEKIETIRKSIV